ncbi:unnamed protein product [Eruca vesicaria subsp. sativa]|uniref:Uncharacterized protein n=1 Tax=Eruca vesicaria subsp. sativa TaxID=29727 RepID=A0ABC8JR64_ERUVS|nr:unnamed protein product [Eruca vesicaria subsp. sativa]
MTNPLDFRSGFTFVMIVKRRYHVKPSSSPTIPTNSSSVEATLIQGSAWNHIMEEGTVYKLTGFDVARSALRIWSALT